MKKLFFALLILFLAVSLMSSRIYPEVSFADYHDSDCSGDGGSCVPLPVPNCRRDQAPPAGVILDLNTLTQCSPGEQASGQYYYEVCDAGCDQYVRSYGPICNIIATPASPNMSTAPSPSVTCREITTTSPGPEGQQIQIKYLDCSPQ